MKTIRRAKDHTIYAEEKPLTGGQKATVRFLRLYDLSVRVICDITGLKDKPVIDYILEMKHGN